MSQQTATQPNKLKGPTTETAVSSPEMFYDNFIAMCNRHTKSHNELLRQLTVLSSNTTHSVNLRKQLLGIPTVKTSLAPSFSDLYNTRMKVDLDYPDMITYNKETGASAKINLQAPTKDRTRVHSILYQAYLATARLCGSETYQFADRVDFIGRSLLELFGITYNCYSANMARAYLRQVSFNTRKKIVALVLSRCSQNNEHEYTEINTTDARQIYNRAMLDDSVERVSKYNEDEEGGRMAKKRKKNDGSDQSPCFGSEPINIGESIHTITPPPKLKPTRTFVSGFSGNKRGCQDNDLSSPEDETSAGDHTSQKDGATNASFSDSKSTYYSQEESSENTNRSDSDNEISCSEDESSMLSWSEAKDEDDDSNYRQYETSVKKQADEQKEHTVNFIHDPTYENSTTQQQNKASGSFISKQKITTQIYTEMDRAFVRRLCDLRSRQTGTQSWHVDTLFSAGTTIGNSKEQRPTSRRRGARTDSGIAHIVLRSETPGHANPHAIAIYDAFSDEWINNLLWSLSTSAFVPGTAGRSNSFVRIATLDTVGSTYFQVGRHFYPSDPANETEVALLDIVNKFLLFQNQHMAHHLQADGNLRLVQSQVYTEGVNTIQVVVEQIGRNSGYGKHSDYGLLLNTGGVLGGSGYMPPQTGRLPYRQEMQTVTIVLSTLQDRSTTTHELKFVEGGRSSRIIGALKTSGNCMHVQLHGTQEFEHMITSLGKKYNNPNDLRVVLSCRRTQPLTIDKLQEAYRNTVKPECIIPASRYQLVDIFQKTTWLMSNRTFCPRRQPQPRQLTKQQPEPPAEITAGLKIVRSPLTTHSKHGQSRAKHNDCFENCPRDHDRMKTIHRNTLKRVGYASASWKFLLRGDVTNQLLREEKIFYTARFLDKDGKNLSALFHPFKEPGQSPRLLLPLCRVAKTEVVAYGNLVHNNRSSPATSGDPTTTNVILLSKPYKNDILSLRSVAKSLASFVTGDRQSEGRGDKIPPIRICGSGGSPRKNDAFTMDLGKMNKEDTEYIAASPQEISKSKQNMTMMELSARRAIVAVFVDEKKFSPFLSDILENVVRDDDDMTDRESCIFLGYFYFTSFECRALSRQEMLDHMTYVNEHTASLPSSKRSAFLQYSRFREEPHFTFTLTPLFDSHKTLADMRETSANGGLREVMVDTTNRTFASVDVADPDSISFIDEYFRHRHQCNKTSPGTVEPVIGDAIGSQVSSLFDMIWHIARVAIATSHRYLCRHVFTEAGKTYTSPLDEGVGLTSIYRAHPLPHPIRTYDVMALFFRGCAIKEGLIDDKQPFERIHGGAINDDIFFMAVLNRLTGRPGVYCDFRRHRNELGKSPLPLISEVDEFLEYASQNDRWRQLFSTQHFGALPADIIRHWSVFSGVVGDLAETCGEILVQIENGIRREKCVSKLAQYLEDVTERNRLHLQSRSQCPAKYAFVAHQVICDLEEVFAMPFGPVDAESIVVGTGGVQGLKACRDILATAVPSGVNREDTAEPIERLQAMLLAFLGGKSTRSFEMRKMLGCGLDSEGTVCVALNGRPFGLQDVEHFLCKLYIGITKTFSSRSSSKSPDTSKSGLHPIDFGDYDCAWDDSNVCIILRDAVDTFDKCRESKEFPITPDIFLVKGEKLN